MHFLFVLAFVSSTVFAYKWENVKIGGGGGFIPGIIFHPTAKGVAYARTDIGGLYRLNSDESWTPLEDWVDDSNWNHWGVNAVALDSNDESKVYISVGMYTTDVDQNNGSILISSDYGTTWAETALPFKLPGNQPGRGAGERLVVDPTNSNIIYLAAPSTNGLYKSTDKGVTFSKVFGFTAVSTYSEGPTDNSGLSSDIIGLTGIVFDTTSGTKNGETSRIFVGVANVDSPSVYVSEDAGATWSSVPGQPSGYFPKRMKFSANESALYITYNNMAGPYNAGNGKVFRYTTSGNWKDITPAWQTDNGLTFGYGGLALDALHPGTLMVASDNLWSPDVQIFRSTDSGSSWTTIWDYNANLYTYDSSNAPWIDSLLRSPGEKTLGWMVASLEIDPFDSDHWLYGTGMTLNGGHDLTNFPNVNVSSLANGIEEEAVVSLIAPPGGNLLSAVRDVGGFQHVQLDVSPSTSFQDPFYASTMSIDYAGGSPSNIVRIGNDGSQNTSQMAISTNGGDSWAPQSLWSNSTAGGQVAYGADAVNIVWNSENGAYRFSRGVQSSISLPADVNLVADKVNGKFFYAADSNNVYVSNDGGATFSSSSNLTSGGVSAIIAHPTVAGDIWLSSGSGIFHSTNFGVTFTRLTSVTSSYAIALGKGSGDYANLYAFVKTKDSSRYSLKLSTDMGSTWTQISDSGHGFGESSGNCLAASMDTEGLVFVGTNGRGIFHGLP